VDQDNNSSTYVSALLASPEKLSAADVPVLRALLEEYPYFQPLRLLLARAGAELPEAGDLLTQAVLHTNGSLVYEFLHKKEFASTKLHISIDEPVAAAPESASDEDIYELIDTKPAVDELEVFDEIGEIDPHEFPVTEVEAIDIPSAAPEIETVEEEFETADIPSAAPEIETVEEEFETADIPSAAPEIETVEEEFETADIPSAGPEIETIEEEFEVEFDEPATEVPEPATEATEQSSDTELLTESAETKRIPAIETEEDAFVLENIMSTDFFAFEQSFSTPATAAPEIEEAREPLFDHEYLEAESAASETQEAEVTEPAVTHPQELEVIAEEVLDTEHAELTNYHDDKMPYTFLWWLAKTRKEHQSIFQPYVSLKKSNQNELQQQYVEHIFHIQSPFNPEEILNNSPEIKGDPKDGEIIDNFIRRDPHISPPRPDQIDNENKARKSAEDHNDVVSETLAKIYIEQMLYHKAIDTYDKLSLKFPEKSRYFADLIQSIKKKI